MCKAMEERIDREKLKWEQEADLNNVKNLMDSTSWSVEKVMDTLKIPVERRKRIVEQLDK